MRSAFRRSSSLLAVVRSSAASRSCAARARSAAAPLAAAASRAAAVASAAAASSARRGRARRLARRLDLRQIGAHGGQQALGSLTPERETLGRALQPVEGFHRALASAGGVGELLLGRVPLCEERPRAAPARVDGRGRCRRAPRASARRASAAARSSSRDARSQPRDLADELLGALGRSRLQRERAEPLAHLVLDVTRALDLDRDPGELQLGAMPARA